MLGCWLSLCSVVEKPGERLTSAAVIRCALDDGLILMRSTRQVDGK